jgi:predicted dehydrogenase
VDDSALLLLTFASGAVGSVDPSWSVPRSNPWHYDFALRVLADGGAITLDDTRQALHVSSTLDEGRGFRLDGFGVNVDEAMIEHFVRCLRAGELSDPAASGEDGYRALEIALAAYESARTGQPVELPFAPVAAA